jgi:hypothetical protein
MAVTVGFELTSSDLSTLCRAFHTRVHAGVDLSSMCRSAPDATRSFSRLYSRERHINLCCADTVARPFLSPRDIADHFVDDGDRDESNTALRARSAPPAPLQRAGCGILLGAAVLLARTPGSEEVFVGEGLLGAAEQLTSR